MTAPDKVLFLDYDGVLHGDSVYLEHRRPVLRGGGSLFQWAPCLISAMEPYPDVRIVLSTTWVRVRGFNRARKALPLALQNRVVGSTWHSGMGRGVLDDIRLPSTWWDRATRYQQIAAYISRAKLRINWLAIDDDELGWPDECRDRLILTNPDLGLSDQVAMAQLCRKLDVL